LVKIVENGLKLVEVGWSGLMLVQVGSSGWNWLKLVFFYWSSWSGLMYLV